VVAIGKVRDLFAGRGITRAVPTKSDDDGMATLTRALDDVPRGLVFANLVDSDTLYGHRNDVAGYAANLERIDAGLSHAVHGMRSDDLLIVTADHGNDPTTPSTDHSREYVPLLVAGDRVAAGRDLGTRATYADLGQTLADNFRGGSAGARHQLSRRSAWHARGGVSPVTKSIRETLEQFELDTLAPQAARSAASRGRQRAEAEDDVRPAFQRDRDRVIHSKAFRRLKHKTQVFFAPAGDHYRTRLTQLARGLPDRAHHCQGAAAPRGAHRGDRAWTRSRAHAVRPRRRERARLARARRGSGTTSRACASWTSSKATGADST
jgi:hypothetical protein